MFDQGVVSDEANKVFDRVDAELSKGVCQPTDPVACKRFGEVVGTVVRVVQDYEQD